MNWWVFILSSLPALLVCGCDIFQTRDPESPTQTTSGYKVQNRPEDVLDNFILAIQNHDIEYYMRCFVDTTASDRRYAFNPSGDFQGLFRAWTLEDERRYFQSLGEPVSGIPFLNFSRQQQLNTTTDAMEMTMDYLLYYPHKRAGIAVEVKGYMHLYFALDNQRQWSIYQWDDARTISDSTWSYLKAHF